MKKKQKRTLVMWIITFVSFRKKEEREEGKREREREKEKRERDRERQREREREREEELTFSFIPTTLLKTIARCPPSTLNRQLLSV